MRIFAVVFYQIVYENFALFRLDVTWLYWLGLFLLTDFAYYWAHRMSHEINLFWGGHVVHHQSEEYNLSVALRQSSFQIVWTFAFSLPIALLGFKTEHFIYVSALNTLYQFWIHTETINKMGWFEYIFNTPSHHRVHHGRNPKYIDKNHGGTLIIWDRLFGTFQKEEEAVVYGITKPLKTWNPLRAQLDFWKDLFTDLSKTKRFSDKLKLLFFPPGWFPQELGGPQNAPEITIATAQKYNTGISAKMNYYVFVQFVIILGLTSMFLFTYEQYDRLIGVLFMALILYSITSIGMILDAKPNAYLVEIGRFVLTILFYWLIIKQSIIQDDNYVGLLILFAFSALSLIVFIPMRKTFAKL